MLKVVQEAVEANEASRPMLDEIVRDHLNSELLKLFAATKKTIAFVTHSIPEAVYLSTKIVVMSPRPGRIVDRIAVPLPRPRARSVANSAEFIALKERCLAHLGHTTEEQAA